MNIKSYYRVLDSCLALVIATLGKEKTGSRAAMASEVVAEAKLLQSKLPERSVSGSRPTSLEIAQAKSFIAGLISQKDSLQGELLKTLGEEHLVTHHEYFQSFVSELLDFQAQKIWLERAERDLAK